MMIWPLLLLIPALVMLLLRLSTHKPNHDFKKLPSPPKLPIIGNLHQLGPLPHHDLAKLAEKYGPVMLLHFGQEPTVVISSTAATTDALKVHDTHFSGRQRTYCAGKLSYNYSDIAFAPYNECWRKMRKITTLELFALKRVQSFHSVKLANLNIMLESLYLSATKREAVDLGKMVYEFTAGIMFNIAFGTSFKGSVMDDDNGFDNMIREAQSLLGTFAAGDYFPYIGWMVDKLNGLHSRLDQIFQKLDKFIDYLIEEHMKSEKKQGEHEDLVDVLLRVQREHVESGATWFTKDQIKGVIFNIFLAGVDTTSLTVIWAMTELVKNPTIMEKAQNEIRYFAAGKDRVSEQAIESLKYLKMVLKETLRLHPPLPLVPKQTTADTQVLGYHIPADTRVYMNQWAMGRDPDVWEEAEKFCPERFEERSVDYKEQNFDMIPFGGGRRMCPGINMGMSTVELAVANMLHCFEWKLPDGMSSEDMNMEEGVGLSTFKKIPLFLVPAKFQT